MIFLILLLNCLQIDKTSYGFGWPGSMLIKENLLYLTNGTVFSIYDISNPEVPKLIKNLSIPFQATTMREEGGYLFVSFYKEGLGIYDISSPLYPNLICIIPELKFIKDFQLKSGILYSIDFEGNFSIYFFLDICTPVLLSKRYLVYVKKILIYQNYAYIVYDGGIAVYNISNPSNPLYLTTTLPVHLDDISIDNGILYGIEDNCIYMVDLSDPANPIDQGYICSNEFYGKKILIIYPYGIILKNENLLFLDINQPFYPKIIGYSAPISQNYDMEIKNNFIYLSGFKGIEILKFDDPHSPLPISNLPELNTYSHTKTYIEDNLLYRLEEPKFEIWDLTDKLNPLLIFTSKNFFFEDFVVSSKIVYFIDSHNLEIWDFSNISSPLLLNSIKNISSRAPRIFIYENYLLCTNRDWFVIFDVSNPSNPIELNFVMDYNMGNNIAFSWPYLAKATNKLRIWDLRNYNNPEIIFEKDFSHNIHNIEIFDLKNILISFDNRDFVLFNIENGDILSREFSDYVQFIKVYSDYIFISFSLYTFIMKFEKGTLKMVGYYPDKGPIS